MTFQATIQTAPQSFYCMMLEVGGADFMGDLPDLSHATQTNISKLCADCVQLGLEEADFRGVTIPEADIMHALVRLATFAWTEMEARHEYMAEIYAAQCTDLCL